MYYIVQSIEIDCAYNTRTHTHTPIERNPLSMSTFVLCIYLWCFVVSRVALFAVIPKGMKSKKDDTKRTKKMGEE